jgi:choline dehydrogenase-like flavoprotein
LFIRSILNGRLPPKARQLPAHVAALWKVALPLAVRYLRSSRAFNPSDGGIDLHLTAEQWPNAESRIVLRDERDDLNLPKVAVDWAIDGREIESMAIFTETFRDSLLRLGLADIAINPMLIARDPAFMQTVEDEYHQMGGARLGASASQGVVDPDLKVYGAENLYVAGAAVYPSSGFGNPTFTAMALGLRLSEHLAGRRP